jgi:hypothetical protein
VEPRKKKARISAFGSLFLPRPAQPAAYQSQASFVQPRSCDQIRLAAAKRSATANLFKQIINETKNALNPREREKAAIDSADGKPSV